MKSQDVKKLKKSVIEKSISSIWSSKKKQKANTERVDDSPRVYNIKTSRKHPDALSNQRSENTNNSNCNKYTNKSDTSLSVSSTSSIKSCSCRQSCENCKCVFSSDHQSVSSSNSFSARKLPPIQSIRFEGDEIILYTNKTSEMKNDSLKVKKNESNSMSQLKTENLLEKHNFLKAIKIKQKLSSILPYLMLLFAGFVPKVLYYGKHSLLYIHKFKRFLTLLFIFSTFYISTYLNHICIFSSIVKQIVYSRDDAFAKIMNSDGKF